MDQPLFCNCCKRILIKQTYSTWLKLSNGADVNGPASYQFHNQLNIQAARRDTLKPVKVMLALIWSAYWKAGAVCIQWRVQYRGFSFTDLTVFVGAKLKSGEQDLVSNLTLLWYY